MQTRIRVLSFVAVVLATVNLGPADGAETFTAAANNDFNLLGTVNINGANGDQPGDDQSPVSGDDGIAETSNNGVNATVEGLSWGTVIALEASETGRHTLTVTDMAGNEVLVLNVQGLGTGGVIGVALDEDGNQAILLTLADGTAVLNLAAEGFAGQANFNVVINANGDQAFLLTAAIRATVRLNLFSLPQVSAVRVRSDDGGRVTVLVTDESGAAIDVTLQVFGADGDVTFNVTYDGHAEDSSGRVVPGYPGFVNEDSLGGSITITAAGLPEETVVTLTLTYEEADLGGIDETALRVQRLNKDTGIYEPAGTHDVGVGDSTGVLGDYGVDTDANSAWAEVSELGTFAVGVPDDTVGALVQGEAGTGRGRQQCGVGAAPCGATGMITWLMMTLGLLAIRCGYRRLWRDVHV